MSGVIDRNPHSNMYDADISTDFGTFRLRIKKLIFPNTYENQITLNIGGKDDCASFTIPMFNKQPIKLSYANSSSNRYQCTLDDKAIKGETTYKMMCLAFTIIREITDQTYIEFQDMSHFECLLPNGEKKDVSLAPFSFLFYGQTWYERRFGAMLVNVAKRNSYMNMKCRRTDSIYKPNVYDFVNNKSLQSMLQPHFETTSSWAEFFDKVAKEYGQNKCHIIYPLVTDILEKYIFKNNFEFLDDTWIMNIDDMPKIPYTIQHVYSDGRQIGGAGGNDIGYNRPFNVIMKSFERRVNRSKYIEDLNYIGFCKSHRSQQRKYKKRTYTKKLRRRPT